MRSRTREAEALLDPAGLGGFHAVSWTTSIAPAPNAVRDLLAICHVE